MTDLLRIRCPHCLREMDVPASRQGRIGDCDYCRGRLMVPRIGDGPQIGDPSAAGPPPLPGAAAGPGVVQVAPDSIVQCPGCRQRLRMEPHLLGKLLACPACQSQFVAQPAPVSATAPRRPGYPAPLPPPPGGIPPVAPGAVAALVCGILGLCLFCLPFLPIIAIVQASKALRYTRAYPKSYAGGGMAVAGIVLGILGLALFGLFVLGLAS